MNVSSAQLARTAENEGFVATAYKDGFVGGVQSYSIGYGHQIQPNEQALRSSSITKAKGLSLMAADGKNVTDFINAHTKERVPNQNQFDAMWDYGYNAGVGALLSNVLNPWNNGASVATVANAIATTRTQYHDTNGQLKTSANLIARRAKEAVLFAAPYFGGLVLFIILAVYTYLYWQTKVLDKMVDEVEHMFI